MLRKLLSLASFLLIITASFGQQFISISVPGSSADISGDYTVVYGSAGANDLYQRFWVYNETAQPIDLHCRRVEMDVTSGTDNATCWSICPPPMDAGTDVDWTSSNVQTIQQDSSDRTFSGHLYPDGVSGCSHFRYYFYTQGQGGMTDSIDVYFEHGATCQQVASIEDEKPFEPKMKLYPNPSKGQFTIDAQIPQQANYNVKIINVVGQTSMRLSNISNGVNTVDAGALAPGMYFVQINDGENAVLTKKIQIAR